MTRPGTVPEAIGAVIAARVHQGLDVLGVGLAPDAALAIGAATARDIRAAGWSITPPRRTAPSPPANPRRRRPVIINLTGETLRMYKPDSPDVLTDPLTGLGAVIDAIEPAADLNIIDLGSPGDDEYRGHVVPIDLAEIHIRHLPPSRPGARYVVTAAIAFAARGRADLLVPMGEVHDPDGTLLGHRHLISPC
ncbi:MULTISPECIES: hypothetical protein [unclassified Streptomyces]|uniref:hypothetical protein n=1 Tax=unclassified Streptomyces TaxID=2593676 RepID=UPI00226D5D4E|nr:MULTISPECIES: hypothetical protein [unclassified Streptomyces]MCY0921865.1 hypothetical protein [Streptomyces sp. H27-G5]MCY0957185.1 hypothetical protein [Streptomyces sp. H27-H5]